MSVSASLRDQKLDKRYTRKKSATIKDIHDRVSLRHPLRRDRFCDLCEKKNTVKDIHARRPLLIFHYLIINYIQHSSHIESQIRFARAYAAEQLPWFAPALFATKIQLTEKVPVAAIDGHLNIYFNPLKIQKIIETSNQMEALQQIGFLWIHEISHILREHNQRAAEGAVDPQIWNIAADMEINDSDWEGLEAPELYPGIYPNTFKMNAGELAETYYKKLTEKSEQELKKGLAKAMDKILADQQEEEKKEEENTEQESEAETNHPEQEGEQEKGDADNTDDPQGSDNDDDQELGNDTSEQDGENKEGDQNESDKDPQNSDDSEEGEGMDQQDGNSDQDESNPDGTGENKDSQKPEPDQDLRGEPQKDPNAPYHELLDEGSGVHNTPRPWEMDTGHDEPQELDEIETEQIRVAVAKEMNEAAKAGLIPAGWERWVGKKLRPIVDWRKVLRHRVSRAINHSVGARIDYSFARPSRRQAVYQPLIPPALSGNLTGQIACVVDTSGSISDEQLNRILSEVCGILEVFNTPVTIIPCDAKAYEPVLLTRHTDLRQITSMPGGGGTNMIRGIEAALELKPVPDVVVVLTDGYTPYPKKLYKTPVLFGIITKDLERTSMLPGSPWRDDLAIKILME